VRLYDTRLRDVVDIEPVVAGELSLYACGPTVYRDAHVGNMRTFLLPDLIRRVAEDEGLTVKVVQNITDVGHMVDDRGLDDDDVDVDEGQGDTEDKLLSEAAKHEESALDIAHRYETRFFTDLDRLNIKHADVSPRASESIELMLDLVSTLLESGHAYVGDDGSVFFDAQSFESYGAISGNKLDELRPGHRSDGGVDPAKRFHADWALWKSAPDERTQLVWETPWGRGFPGWHLECSAMSLKHLGTAIDVHTGGIDLRFPHHEDERAQSNSAAGTDVVRHWVHGEHLLFEGRKMSKSAGNVVLVEDLINRGIDPLALRLAFLEHHYRQQFNLTWNTIEAADKTLARWRTKVAEWSLAEPYRRVSSIVAEVRDGLAADLDTARAILALRTLERDSSVHPGAAYATFAWADHLLGLDLTRGIGSTVESASVPGEVAELAHRREQARAEKDWASSDSLRDELNALGWVVTDTADGQQLSKE
jgi:cysteinyl-tRNA synthetase